LATDFCSGLSALDAAVDFKVRFIRDASKPVFPAKEDAMLDRMRAFHNRLNPKGIEIITVADVLAGK
jgi:hypothetical protein